MKWPWNRKNLADVWTWPVIFWLNIFGWWGEEAETRFARKWLTKFRSISYVYLVVLLTSMIIQMCIQFSEGDLLQNLFTIYATVPGFIGVFKIVDVVRHRRLLRSVMDRLSAMVVEIDNPVVDMMARKCFKRAWIILFFTLLILDSVCLHWMFRPLIVALFHHEKTRIVETWPVFLDNWFQFFLSFLYHLPCILICGHGLYMYDIMYFCTSEVILCHFAVLRYRLNNLKLNDSQKSSKELVSCVKYHSNIISVCNDFKDATASVLLWHAINNVILLCTGIFILTYFGKVIPFQASINLGETSFLVTTCFYFYCWYSNEITFQCTDVSNAVYMVDWVNGKDTDKKTMIITMSRAMQPVLFGGILEITLETFINVLKTAFSFYNFLIAVQTSSSESN